MAAVLLTDLVSAQATLTLGSGDSQLPHADDTTIVGGQTYTWKSTVSTTADQVKIGGTLVASIANLIAAINKASGGGTTYGSATVKNPYCSAAVGSTTTMVVTASTPGIAGNFIPSAGTMTHGSWDAAVLGTTTAGAGDLGTPLRACLNILKANKGLNSDALAYVGFLLADMAY